MRLTGYTLTKFSGRATFVQLGRTAKVAFYIFNCFCVLRCFLLQPHGGCVWESEILCACLRKGERTSHLHDIYGSALDVVSLTRKPGTLKFYRQHKQLKHFSGTRESLDKLRLSPLLLSNILCLTPTVDPRNMFAVCFSQGARSRVSSPTMLTRKRLTS